MSDTHEAKAPPSLWERLARLAGGTTYREPVGGRTNRAGALPVDHAVCIALGWARDPDDRHDIGPDLAIDIATCSGRNMHKIVRAVAEAIDAGAGNRGHRAIRRSRPYLRIVASDAYARLVYGHRYEKPEGMAIDDWELLTEAAVQVMERMADNALARAERAMRKRA